MKIAYLKKQKIYLPIIGSSTVVRETGTLNYFISGEGHKQTRAYEILPDEFPEKWDTSLSWLDVARMHDKYGIYVAEYYAECKTAGIVAREAAKGYHTIYSKIKHMIDDHFDVAFFECLCYDSMLLCFGMFLFDIIATDKNLALIDPDYNDIKCTYKGEPASMRQYVERAWGERYVQVIDELLKS